MKRFLNMKSSELTELSREEFLGAIAGSEGRILVSETIGTVQPLLSDVTNAEFAASMGADIILLNMFDVQDPLIRALPEVGKEEVIREVKKLTGRPVGIDLEPVDEAVIKEQGDPLWGMSAGRYASAENARLAVRMGADLIVLTGNPGNGVNNRSHHLLASGNPEGGGGIRLRWQRARCMRLECWEKVESISSRRQISGNLPMREQILFSCLRRGRYRELLQNIFAVW